MKLLYTIIIILKNCSRNSKTWRIRILWFCELSASLLVGPLFLQVIDRCVRVLKSLSRYKLFEYYCELWNMNLFCFLNLTWGFAVFLNVILNLKTNLFCSYKNIYRELEQNIKTADAVEDLRWFRANQGPGMSMNWPQFEVRSQYLKPRLVLSIFFLFAVCHILSGVTIKFRLLAVNFVAFSSHSSFHFLISIGLFLSPSFLRLIISDTYLKVKG